jgi:hypothetical protein
MLIKVGTFPISIRALIAEGFITIKDFHTNADGTWRGRVIIAEPYHQFLTLRSQDGNTFIVSRWGECVQIRYWHFPLMGVKKGVDNGGEIG